jgi:hypothetical protein
VNKIEKQMLQILLDLKKNSNAIAVKAEFEAEGTRTEELLRLLEIARRADMKIALKIGGCEAMRDLIEAKQFGVDFIIAPMVETSYALEKFIEAKNKVYSEEERLDVDFLVNIETKSGLKDIDNIVRVANIPHGIQGLVFGRVDFVGSFGWARDSVDSEQVINHVVDVAEKCKFNNLDLVVGGGVSINSIDALKKVKQDHLTRFETRKVVFSSEALSAEGIKTGILNAVHFELLWLINKREYYSLITREDDKRIEMLDNRWKLLNR